MKIQNLEDKISVRADEEVQKKIKEFKRIVDVGLNQLFGTNIGIGGHVFGNYWSFEGRSEEHCESGRDKLEVLKMAIRDTETPIPGSVSKKLLPWPGVLWQVERDRIRNDLLEKMDLMQRLVSQKSTKSDSDVPEKET